MVYRAAARAETKLQTFRYRAGHHAANPAVLMQAIIEQ